MNERRLSVLLHAWALSILTSAASVFSGGDATRLAAENATAENVAFFERKIRPVLVKHCYPCHSAEAAELRGEFLLDSRAGMRRGGQSGPAIVPGRPEESLLIDALRYGSREMPPTEQLPAAVIADFVRWIRIGAPDPRDGSVATKRTDPTTDSVTLWSLAPLVAPEIPAVKDTDWPRSDIDRFALAALEAKGPSASRRRPAAHAPAACTLRTDRFAADTRTGCDIRFAECGIEKSPRSIICEP